ncbi:MAG: hypothetical protein HQ582_22670, partial [Planctomycetes bacterium]|nr:hypothetical protein [Planctomycetota bacterium]
MKLTKSCISRVGMGAWALLLSGAVWGSTVTVDLNDVNPDPSFPCQSIAATATATFTADGDDQREQQEEGATPEFRWLWEFLGDGTVTSTNPALDPENPPWTVWSTQNSSSGNGSVPTAGYKTARITVQARMKKSGGEEEEDYVGETVQD